jgi:hypothetical protein
MEGILSTLLTTDMGGLAASVVVLMLFVGKIPLKNGTLNCTKFWKDFGTFITMALCCGGAFIPGIRPEGEIGVVIVFGLLSTLAAHLSRKILAPIFLRRLEGKK